jgi:hypothetical protein
MCEAMFRAVIAYLLKIFSLAALQNKFLAVPALAGR